MMNEVYEMVKTHPVLTVLVFQMELAGQVTVAAYQIIIQVMTVMTVRARQMVRLH